MKWLPVFLLAGVVGCSSSNDDAVACTDANWSTCETPPSLDVRSQSWPDGRAALASLADATEWAVQNPASWSVHFPQVTVPLPPDVYTPDSRFGATYDVLWRRYPIRDARSSLKAAVAAYDNEVAKLRTKGDNAVSSDTISLARSQAEGSWLQIHKLELFRDSYGQPEPRSALLAYASIATQTQFLLTDPSARRARAVEASAFLEERIGEWNAMQRDRLSGRPDAEVQDAVDALGGPELRRIMNAWSAIPDLTIAPGK